MSQRGNLTVGNKNNGMQNKRVRIFSARGAHLVCILSKTDIAKALWRWLLDLVEKESKPQAELANLDMDELKSLTMASITPWNTGGEG